VWTVIEGQRDLTGREISIGQDGVLGRVHGDGQARERSPRSERVRRHQSMLGVLPVRLDPVDQPGRAGHPLGVLRLPDLILEQLELVIRQLRELGAQLGPRLAALEQVDPFDDLRRLERRLAIVSQGRVHSELTLGAPDLLSDRSERRVGAGGEHRAADQTGD
jgi:hypothetical protein